MALASSSLPIMPSVSGVFTTCRVRKSATRDELLEAEELDVDLPGPLRGDERVVGDDLHAEGGGPLGDELADAAEPDDAERLVGQLDALPPSTAPSARR